MFICEKKKRKFLEWLSIRYERVPRVEKLPVSIIYALMLFVAGDCSPEVS